ncbi:unnamed protein product [Macrosiphum euphorbiae]|uniref:Uncharacterized protein n=1 Tax=Macrosiphum euphorbiae TaxID=13131 RepID=A0AAV0W649_9HEMI|nr:unnamed protein product [Macrosiphum euphorbiae]
MPLSEIHTYRALPKSYYLRFVTLIMMKGQMYQMANFFLVRKLCVYGCQPQQHWPYVYAGRERRRYVIRRRRTELCATTTTSVTGVVDLID